MASHPSFALTMRYLLLSFLVATSAACTYSTVDSSTSTTTLQPVASTTTLVPTSTTTLGSVSASPLAEFVKPIGSAVYDPDKLFQDRPAPIGLHIDAIGVNDATIVPVGILDNGEMEIPGAKEVGWYQYGPTPGDAGSAVLAAHIAYNGRNGVFNKLTAMSVGDLFEVAYDDGSYRTFVVTEVAQYDKTELPFDRIFAKDGDPGVVLITCGGTFNQSLRSYEDNDVVYGTPTPNSP